jgi:monofunctional chorismate mutase
MNEIQNLREKINEIDSEIAQLLKNRLDSVKKIGDIKKTKNLPIIDKNREDTILSKLDSDYEREIFKKILSESRNLQI